MKTNNLSNQANKLRDNETPFRVINMGGFDIKLYHTPKGTYGHQVLGIVWGPYNPDTESCLVATAKSSGYGYCKEDSVLGELLQDINLKPLGMKLFSESIPHDHHVGGNYYYVTNAQTESISAS